MTECGSSIETQTQKNIHARNILSRQLLYVFVFIECYQFQRLTQRLVMEQLTMTAYHLVCAVVHL